MPIHLENEALANIQQMEVAVNGPDGATHLILCTGVANLGASGTETYTFLVGPKLTRRQFVGVIASGALTQFQSLEFLPTADHFETQLEANLISMVGGYDDATSRVKVWACVSLGAGMTKLAISFNVNILAELHNYSK